MKSEKISTFFGKIRFLANFWPAGLVVLAVVLTLPKTLPVLKEIPERLIMTEVAAAEEKPALPDPVEAAEEPVEDSGNTYEDGVYTGSSRGYGGMVTVQVTVAEKKISQVSVTSAPGETAEFLSKAKGVIDKVIQAQTWEVDVVSGATFSSRGILGAIQNALTGETVQNETPPAQPEPAAPLTQTPFDDSAVWKDGTYIGTAMGFGGTIKVEVTISGGKIADIKVLSHSGETDSYYNKAKKVVQKIIAAGTPNVDTISGATYSSNGIINAVKNALQKAAGASGNDSTGDDASTQTPAKTPADDTKEPDLSNGLKDGTYTVDVPCTDGRIFDYKIRLTMVVKDGKIRSLTAERIEDKSADPDTNATYLGYAVNGRTVDGKTYKSVTAQVLAQQSTRGVDTVSGATYSSEAILRGVKKLLAQAAKDKSQAQDDGDDEDENAGAGKTAGKDDNQDEEPEDEPEPEDGLEDGTYTLDAACTDDPTDPLFDYTVRVTMKVENGEITSITAKITEDRSDDPSMNKTYFGYATDGRTLKGVEYRSVIAQMLEKQSAKDIDTVSGATWSSKTIINAVKKLLWQAAKNPEEEQPGEENDDPGNGDDPGQGTDDPGSGDDPGQGTDDPGSGDDPGTEDADGLADGTYTSDVVCTDYPDDPTFDYTLRITTVIEDGKITSVDVTCIDDRSEEPDDNTSFLNFAVNGRTRKGVTYPGVPDQVLEAQGTSGVDTISGATWSSKAILEGVRDTLEQASKNSSQENDGEEESGTGDSSEPGKTGDEGSGTGDSSEPGKTGDEGSGTDDSSEPGKTGGEGSGTDDSNEPGKTDDEGSGTDDSSEPGKTDDEGSGTGDSNEPGKTDEEGSGTDDSSEPGKTGGEGSGTDDSSEPGKTDDEESGTGDSSETGKTGEEGSGTGDSSETGKTDGEESETGKTDDNTEETKKLYKDGTYTAKEHCTDDPSDPFFDYYIKVTVKVEDGEITEITTDRIDDESEDPDENEYYMGYAINGRKKTKGIPQQVLDSQSASGLDTVSGATYSSNAMIKALKEAVNKAKNE